jgi:hypothetical protein
MLAMSDEDFNDGGLDHQDDTYDETSSTKKDKPPIIRPHGTSETSKDAARGDEAKFAQRREEVYQAIVRFGLYGATAEQAEDFLPVRQKSVSSRIKELVHQRRVVNSCRKRKNRTTKEATVWVATEFVPLEERVTYVHYSCVVQDAIEHAHRISVGVFVLERVGAVRNTETSQALSVAQDKAKEIEKFYIALPKPPALPDPGAPEWLAQYERSRNAFEGYGQSPDVLPFANLVDVDGNGVNL